MRRTRAATAPIKVGFVHDTASDVRFARATVEREANSAMRNFRFATNADIGVA